MDSSFKTGLMAVFAVSGSVVFVAMQVHKRLLSKFMEKMEVEFINSTGTPPSKEEAKKKVRFADDIVAGLTANENASGRTAASGKSNDENLEALPENWQVMYKEILQQRNCIRNCN